MLHQQADTGRDLTRPDTGCPCSTTRARRSGGRLFDLIAAFKDLLSAGRPSAHEVETRGKSVESRMEELLALIREGESLEFTGCFNQQTKRR